MKTFANMGAQGDLLIRRVDSLPTGEELTEIESQNGQLVVAHSETGHNHFFDVAGAERNVHLYASKDPMVCYLTVEGDNVLQHARPFDQHEAINFTGGTYELRRQREYTPEGWRRVED